MNADEVYGGKYLAASDIMNRTPRVQLRMATVETLGIPGKQQDTKIVLHFVGCKKAMALNKSNYKQVREVLGAETDSWPGTWFTIGTARKTYRDDIVDGLVILKIEPVVPVKPEVAPNGDGKNEQPTTF